MSARRDPFSSVIGPGRGGGRKASTPDTLPATGLARFSCHPASSAEFLKNRDPVAALDHHVEELAAEAALIRVCVNAGWQTRPATVAQNMFLSVEKLFAGAQEAGEELQALGATDTRLDFFPSGSPQERAGYQSLHISAHEVHFVQIGRRLPTPATP